MAEKLLVVDDDEDTLKLVRLMLSRQGYDVISGERGGQALELARSEAPDLILLDVMMPDMDGFEVARRLRADEQTANIPIIMFTAKTQVEDKITGLEAGADAYLTKPTQPRELFAQVKSVLARARKSRSATPQISETDRGFIVSVLGVKGGLGVSSMATNLGITIHRKGHKPVLVAELRPGYGGISLELGYLNPESLKLLLKNKPKNITPQEIELSLVTHTSGVKFLLASPHPKDAELSSAIENFEAILRYLPYLARYTVLDLGSSLAPVARMGVQASDIVVVAVEPTPNGVHQTRFLLEDLYELGIGEGRVRIVLVNRVRSSVQLTWSQVQEELGQKVATVITPAPELAYQASATNIPMVMQQPGSITAQQFEKLAALIIESIEIDGV
jgi:DNA-binding response OmpR family regulator